MAISINWLTRVISIPRADLTLVQSTPTEIRELNLNDFRLELKDLEDSELGMVNPDTHRHNTEVTLGGIIFARVIEIINGYTITFEDGQYAVNLVGANSNVGDVVNVNQVSVRSQNSAGLISSSAIEHSSFNGGVYIDVVNGTTGTVFPRGTLELPVDNLADAKLIAEFRGLSKLFILGDITFLATDDIDGFTVVGQNPIKTSIVLTPGLSSSGCEFLAATVNGTLDGNSLIMNCNIDDLTYVEGIIKSCILRGTITLSGSTTTNILDCHDGIAGDDKPVIDMGGGGQALTVGGYNGELELVNKNGPDNVSIDLVAGEVVLNSSVTNGEIDVRGVGRLIDNTTGTASVNWTALISRDEYDNSVYVDTSSIVSGTNYPAGTNKVPVNNIADAILIAGIVGVNVINLKGDVTLTGALVGFVVKSSSYNYASVNLNGQDVQNTVFEGVTLTGDGVNFFTARNCLVESGMTNIWADFDDSIISGTFTVMPGEAFRCKRCNMPGMSTVLNLNASGSIAFYDCAGICQVTNLANPTSTAVLTGALIVTALPTCTSGTMMVTGTGIFTDLSAGATVTDKMLPQSTWAENDIYDLVVRDLGLSQENIFIDNTVYDGDGQLTGSRVRIFDSKANCDAATDGGSETTGLIATYTQGSVWEALSRFGTYRQTRE